METRNLYGERLITLAIFGSVARGTAAAESDVDLLIVSNGLPQGRIKRVSEFAKIERNCKPVVPLSPVIKAPEEVLSGSPLFLDMVYDAMILYDKDLFFTNYLSRLKERLDRLGAKRVVQGDRWYWDLKPDYRAGEVFEI
jgi:hypothetical protein